MIKTNEYQPVLSHRIFPFLLIFNSVFTVLSTMGVIRGIRWPHITSMVSNLSYKEKKTLTPYNSRTLIGDKYMESTACATDKSTSTYYSTHRSAWLMRSLFIAIFYYPVGPVWYKISLIIETIRGGTGTQTRPQVLGVP